MARNFISVFIANCAFSAAVAIAGSWADTAFVRIANAAETAAANATLTPSDVPKRKAGWWEFRSSAKTSGPSDEQLCVGERSETVFSAFDQLAPEDWCTVRDFHRDGDGWSYKSVCDYGAGDITTIGVIDGDLTSDYTVHLKISGKTMGIREGTLTAQWTSPCPDGKKDGDRVVGGYTISVLEP